MNSLSEPVSILMPVYNEEDVIEPVLREWIDDVVSKLPEGSELVLDDASTDRTPEILARLQVEHSSIRIITSKRDGFFNAALRLYRAARNPLVFFTDSDGQYVPSEFWRVVERLDGADMVHGAKMDRKDPWYRVNASKVFNQIVRSAFGIEGRDMNSAFRLIRKPVIDALVDEIQVLTMLPNTELFVRATYRGYRIEVVDVEHRVRMFGESRSLPLGRFIVECWKAYGQVMKLRRELRSAAPAAARAGA